MCHDNKAGFLQRILGNSYGHLILENKWESDADPNSVLRFCHKDYDHDVYPTLLTADVDGKLTLLCVVLLLICQQSYG